MMLTDTEGSGIWIGHKEVFFLLQDLDFSWEELRGD